MTDFDAGPLTEYQKEFFQEFTDNIKAGCGIALVSSEIDGKQVAVMVGVKKNEPDDVLLLPLAILIDDDWVARMTPPGGSFLCVTDFDTDKE